MSPGASVDNVMSAKWVKYHFQVNCPFKRENVVQFLAGPELDSQGVGVRCYSSLLRAATSRFSGQVNRAFHFMATLPGRRNVYEVSNLTGIPFGGNFVFCFLFFFFSLSPTRPSVAVQTPENNVPL